MIVINAEIISGTFAPYVLVPSPGKKGFGTFVFNGAGVNSGTAKFTWTAYEK